MKKVGIILVISILIGLVTSCGVSAKDRENMQTSLDVRLFDEYSKQKEYVCMFLNAELKSIEKKPFRSLNDGFSGVFSCSFEDNGNSVYITGTVGFDKWGFVADMPEELAPLIGKNKIAVDVSSILVNGKNTSVADSKYNISCFVSNRK